MQEKEQLLTELRKVSSATEAEVVSCRIRQLEHDLQQHTVDYSGQQYDADKYVSDILYSTPCTVLESEPLCCW